ncbi:MAG: hypothetical protein ACI9F9_002378, partial [Candidatus Paceibacteria bacterium]
MSGKDGENSFGSFKDMFRAKGEEVPVDEPATDKGWTLEQGDGVQDAEGEERLSTRGQTPRERIDQRPPAFGPMDTGPPCYADAESEEMELVSSFRVRTVFPKDVLAEVSDLPPDPLPADFEGREDLRQE